MTGWRGGEQIADACFLESDFSDIPKVWDMGPVSLEDGTGVLGTFSKSNCLKVAGSLGSDAPCSDAGEQVDVRSFFIHCSN